ncbi:MAG TPA: signal peptide peptidase SppA [Bacteroidia bacterium]|nr:signal peptide peptidase SppA [Bacteroidia bacterium]HRS58231.1 signal peptide peptidase SppA [Bacteroidia bacterium]HRU68648.1 signal peptide peptidase SppA [Bacteroidia bacterium]
MKGFFKYVFASMIGFVLAYIVIAIIMFSIIMGTVSHYTHKLSKSEKEVVIKEGSVLMINLNQPLMERTDNMPFSEFSFFDEENFPSGLKEMMDKIEKAKTDDKIKGIYLNLGIQMSPLCMLNELRNELIDFKKSGKFIYAYAEILTNGTYYLASVADKIYMQPEGIAMITGFNNENVYLKGLFEKLDIQPTLIRAGNYKSAGETFTRSDMSPYDRKQMEDYLYAVYNQFITEICQARKISNDSLKNAIDGLKIHNADDALKYRLIDGLAYKDEFIDFIKKEVYPKKDPSKVKINLVKITSYYAASKEKKDYTKDKIALIYAVGNIGTGEGDYQNIGSESLSRALRQAREDEDVKAIVLRINSPGGGALPSDVIWREVKLAADKKPLVVSMGSLAASGGYYIAAPADSILADPFTITGSIGVFGLHLNLENFWKNKLGITFDRVKTSKNADFSNFNRPLSPEEKAILEYYVNDTYSEFKKRVADGRKLDMAFVDSIAQGHIYTGTQALKIGLVDKIGGLNDALEMAARMAKIDNYRLKVLPKYKGFLQNFGLSVSGAKAWVLRLLLGNEDYQMFKKLKEVPEMKGGIYMLMTYSLTI